MNQHPSHITELWRRFANKEATDADLEQLFAYLQQDDNRGTLLPLLEEYFRQPAATDEQDREYWIAKLHEIMPGATANIPPVRRIPSLRRWWAAAAVFLLLLGVSAYLWYQDSNRPQKLISDNQHLPTNIGPGRDGAILTLADGSQVVLDSLGNGMVAMQDGAQVRLVDGQLAYDPTGETSGEMVYNTMRTPKGRQFSLLLPDGTRVWLNAASSIRYPTVFAGKERRVEVIGEAYFEVARNTEMPFRVNVNNRADIEVLGTHFNINAYENESTINTTLLEGSVKVNGITIRPGQQAQITTSESSEWQPASSPVTVINNSDMDKVMAWRNGLFNFNGLTFEEIMRQLERWYDIEVVYENNKVPDKRLAGEMTRDVSLNDLLKQLGEMGVRHRLDKRRLIVLP